LAGEALFDAGALGGVLGAANGAGDDEYDGGGASVN